ncbi:UTP--glucose-1-phosphate uridylyltransferase [Candidatus Liberibacter sp.]|uniref:UTP--glucose-1-phosphate uridylyltransferase n=1 Tax=Candidatus Liberibacter sp. TaxID=34022 RepID=UPI0015F6F57E|nr:UTP--glucose-1-phosphate uridylyltransferase [Candidatus Liberibacter sp.]MBA5724417.1 UTP--glucose-1-phosphate uridylyltransferase [Candidatus Liberibacter sp.]
MGLFKKLRKAVFPVGGLGVRFLPITKVVPKEMLTVVDKPVIQYVVDEALEAGLTHFVFVTGRSKGSIEDYFDVQFELEQLLKKRKKTAELTLLTEGLLEVGTAIFTRQYEPKGLGHAVWCARHIVGDEPFALLLPDMIMQSLEGENCIKNMMNLYEKRGSNILSVAKCDPNMSHNYGIVEVEKSIDEDSFFISDMIEKPDPDKLTSNLFLNGRYILQPDIFNILADQEKGSHGEIQLTDAMRRLSENQKFLAYRFRGRTHDCGSKEGLILANVAFALARKEIRSDIETDLKNLLAALK